MTAAGSASTIWLLGTTWGLIAVVVLCGLGPACADFPLIIMNARRHHPDALRERREHPLP